MALPLTAARKNKLRYFLLFLLFALLLTAVIQPVVVKRPLVIKASPENGAQQVSNLTAISTRVLQLPHTGIDPASVTASSVYLAEKATGLRVPAHIQFIENGNAITLVPTMPLQFNTSYVFTVTGEVKDSSGASFIPYASTFTTGASSTAELAGVRFEQVPLPNTAGIYTSLTMGPDGKLYALRIDGVIKRFPLNADGTLGEPEVLYALQEAYGKRQPTLAIGLAFDPASTATNLTAWVTHSAFAFSNAPDWSGKLTRLQGNKLQNVQDVLVNLPRSTKDHATNSIAFGPDGALYFLQGSTSAMGGADKTWSYRKEHLLSAAVLRLDTKKLGPLPLDVKTPDGGGTYDPYSTHAPLTLYATGIRNAYDLVWHSNGELYVPTNGSDHGGNTPAAITGTVRPDGTPYSGPAVPALTNVRQTQKDFLFRVTKGGYYGHPNPVRGEYVLNGGNPTLAMDPAQTDAYPIGTLPDANWRGFAFDFQLNKSPDGAIEYQSNTFNGALKGKLLVVRYSQGQDIMVLTPGDATHDIVSSTEGSHIPGFSNFAAPLDLTEDVRTGNIYVSEFGGDGRIMLLRPTTSHMLPKVIVPVVKREHKNED